MRFLKIFSALTVVTVLLYLVSAADDGSVYHDVLRLHVIADSDDAAAQEIKLEVRDLILGKYGERLSGYENKEQAEEVAKSMLGEMEEAVNAYLCGRVDYGASVTLAEEYFPTKQYGEYSLPRGVYTALCVRLGRAEGKNFWCVLYPPLCLGAATAEDGGESLFLSSGLSEEEYELMRGEKPVYKVRFKLLEWLNGEEKKEK